MFNFKVTTVSMTAVLAVAASSAAFATDDEYTDYAHVVAAQPVYARVAHSIPQEECRVEQVRYEYPVEYHPSATGTLFGTMLGAAVGHQIGHDRDGKRVGRVAGAILGASIGHDLSRRSAAPERVEYRDEEHCATRYSTQYEQAVVGYDVTYEYNGKMYHTRMDRDPGSQMKVAVDVQPYQD
jgi:uncharacterized protein YcfJ